MKAAGIMVEFGSLLEYGCGVRRVCHRALSRRFKPGRLPWMGQDRLPNVLLRLANQHIGRHLSFIHNIVEDQSIIPKDSIDCLYTNMVMQHLPEHQIMLCILDWNSAGPLRAMRILLRLKAEQGDAADVVLESTLSVGV